MISVGTNLFPAKTLIDFCLVAVSWAILARKNDPQQDLQIKKNLVPKYRTAVAFKEKIRTFEKNKTLCYK